MNQKPSDNTKMNTSENTADPQNHRKTAITTRFSHYSIKKKLVIFTMLSTLTTLLLALTAIINLDRMLTKENMVEEVKMISQILAARSEVALSFGDKRNSQSNLNSLKNSPEYVLACLYGRHDELYASFPLSDTKSNCPEIPERNLANFEAITSQYIHQWTQINRNGQEPIGHLYMRRSLSSLNERLTKFTIASAGITFFVIIIGYAIIGRLQKIISKPILDLSAISTQIAQDNDYQRRATIAGEDEIGALSRAFNTMLDTIEKAQKKLTFMAFYDALTGLPNRRYFMETLERQITSVTRHHQSIALFLIDLDGFKGVNDTIGHDAGDMVLTTVSKRIPKLLRKGDVVARLGGDEFTIILSHIATPATLRKIALQLITAIEEPIEFKGQRADVSASIGIARAPADGTSMDSVLKLADAAMYRAKAGGKNTFYFYDEIVDQQMKAFNTLETQLKTQLDQHQSVLQYQPIIHLKTQDTIGLLAYLTLTNTVTNSDDHTTDNISNFATIRHLANPNTCDTMMHTVLESMTSHITKMSHVFNHYPHFKIIIPVNSYHFQDTAIQTQLQYLSQQLEINGATLLYAVDRDAFESQLDSDMYPKLMLSDNGDGLESLNAFNNRTHWVLSSLPQDTLSEWENQAWLHIRSSAKNCNTNIIGMNINSQNQLNLSKALGISYGTGHAISPLLSIQDTIDWLNNDSQSIMNN